MDNSEEIETALADDLVYRIPVKDAIVITHSWARLTPAERDQLSRIADTLRQRIHPRLGLEYFRIVETDQLDLSSWKEKPRRLIYFGPAIKGLNMYELIEAGGTRMVLSQSLADLISDTAARTRLWQALQQLFSS